MWLMTCLTQLQGTLGKWGSGHHCERWEEEENGHQFANHRILGLQTPNPGPWGLGHPEPLSTTCGPSSYNGSCENKTWIRILPLTPAVCGTMGKSLHISETSCLNRTENKIQLLNGALGPWVVTQHPTLHRAPHLVWCSTLAILKSLTISEQGPCVFILHPVLLIP